MDEKPSSSSNNSVPAAPELAHIPSEYLNHPSSSVHTTARHGHLKFGDIEHTTFAHAAASDREGLDKHREFERVDALARRTHNSRRYLFRRPRALQYFRGNTLVRDPGERTSQRLE